MAKKKPAKKSVRKSAGATVKKTAAKKSSSTRKTPGVKKTAAKKTPVVETTVSSAKKKTVEKTETQDRPRTNGAAEVVEKPVSTRKKGVRKATLSSGIKQNSREKRLGRSRIPVDAPLDVVFQNDLQAREAFVFLGIHTVRELERFKPDELVMRLTSPAKQTVGRIRKILAMNNRALTDDDGFALEFQERLSTSQATNTQ
jgi:hypothetical protein